MEFAKLFVVFVAITLLVVGYRRNNRNMFLVAGVIALFGGAFGASVFYDAAHGVSDGIQDAQAQSKQP
jgi:hypothetical protein